MKELLELWLRLASRAGSAKEVVGLLEITTFQAYSKRHSMTTHWQHERLGQDVCAEGVSCSSLI